SALIGQLLTSGIRNLPLELAGAFAPCAGRFGRALKRSVHPLDSVSRLLRRELHPRGPALEFEEARGAIRAQLSVVAYKRLQLRQKLWIIRPIALQLYILR